jgi:hypothetical protein
VITNTLSRRDADDSAAVMALSVSSFQLFDDLRQELGSDLALLELAAAVQVGNKGDQWRIVDGLITVRGKVYVPPSSPPVQLILASAHGTGHEETEKTLHRIHADFFLPGAPAMVCEFMRVCVTCQCHKSEQLHPAGLL